MIIQIVEAYSFVGLIFVIAYMLDVGRRISEKYSCGLLEGIARFEKAGSLPSNIIGVLEGIVIWPALFLTMKNGIWEKTLKTMVDENDY